MAQERFTNRLEVTDDEGPAPKPVFVPKAPQDEAEQKPKPEPKVQQKADDEPDGSDFVEFDDPKVKARFSRVYRHAKEANERAERTANQVALLAEQNKKLQDAIGKLSAGIKDKDARAELTTLRQEAKDALATGDTEAFSQAQEGLVEIKLETTKAEEKPEEAAEEGEAPLTETELRVMAAWQGQKGENGKFVRPWAVPGHPEFASTMEMVRKISARPDMKDVTVRELLAAVDRRMRAMLDDDDGENEQPTRRRAEDDGEDENPVRRAFSAPRGQAPVRRDRQEVGLSPQEKAIAETMFLGGRGAVAKTAKEAHEVYLKQKRALSRAVAVED